MENFSPTFQKVELGNSTYFQQFHIIFSFVFLKVIHRKWSDKKTRERRFSIRQSMWYFWSVFLSLGNDDDEDPQSPISTSGRILTSFWSVFVIIFLATFTANLAAIFGHELADRPLTHVDQLDEQLDKKPRFITYTFE